MIMQIITSKFIFGVMYMLFSEILLWLVIALFIIGIVMTLESKLSSIVGLCMVCCTSIFFIYYFSFAHHLAMCILFGGLVLIAVRYLIAEFK